MARKNLTEQLKEEKEKNEGLAEEVVRWKKLHEYACDDVNNRTEENVNYSHENLELQKKLEDAEKEAERFRDNYYQVLTKFKREEKIVDILLPLVHPK